MSILIDDNQKNGEAWEKAGGTFIFHKGGKVGGWVRAMRTIFLLKKVIFPDISNLRQQEALGRLVVEAKRVKEEKREKFPLFLSALEGEVIFIDDNSGFSFFLFFCFDC